MKKDNSTMAISHLVAALGIPVTRQTINDELNKHPDFNSLLAISEVLENLNIPNAAYNISFDQLNDEIKGPFIAVTASNQFLLVNHLDGKQAIVSNERWNKHRMDIEEFKKQYSGKVLIAEKDEESGEPDYKSKRRKEIGNNLRLPAVIGSAAALLACWLLFRSSYLDVLNWQTALLTLFKTAGLVTAVLLLMQSIDSNNPLIQKLCGGDNNKNDCNAILSSKAAKVTEELSWSEVGFFYFAGTWLVFIFNSNNSSVIAALAFLNIISLPYTFYSILHQWKVAKQWCKLCLAVQAVLWLEFFAFLPTLIGGLHAPALNDYLVLFTGLVIPVLGWVLLKPYLLLSKQIAPLKSQLRQFKYNKELFDKMLKDEMQYALPEDSHTVILGNPEAENVITMVSNPYCQPCAKAHKALEWLEGRDDVKLQVVFSTQNETDKNAQVALHLLAMQQSQSGTSLKKALDDWYSQKQKSYSAWAEIYPKTTEITDFESLNKQREWCKLTEIKGTPTLFLNGRKLPYNYQPEDLKYFI
jgi:hypothetical protein